MKPPYRVPTMEEIRALPPNGLTVASTFSGGGGSSTGYKLAGFRVVWANEFIPAAAETYRANHPDTILDTRDIRTVQPEEIRAALESAGVSELDVLDGSPPCASFSSAGKREKAWGKVKKYSDSEQRTDDLFLEYIRILRGLKPRAFVAENVAGLGKGTAKGWFLEILRELKASGYRVACRQLDAQWLGVPQARQRLIFLGFREDLEREPVFPAPLPYRYSIREALPWLDRVIHDTSGQYSSGDVTDRPSPAITIGVNSLNSTHFKVTGRTGPGFARVESELDRPMNAILVTDPDQTRYEIEERAVREGASIERFAIGKEWDRLGPGEQSEKYADAPSPTILASHGNAGMAGVTHPSEKRKFSIAELLRICGFPDDYVLTGDYRQQWERCGRSVPPVMMSHVAREVAAVLRGVGA